MGPRIVDAGRGISVTSGHTDGTLGLSDDLAAPVSEENLCDGPESCRGRFANRSLAALT